MIEKSNALPEGTMLHQGQVTYRIEEVLHEGGASIVYQVVSNGHKYALKESFPQSSVAKVSRLASGALGGVDCNSEQGAIRLEKLVATLKRESLLTERLASSNHLIQVVRVLEDVTIQLPGTEIQSAKVSNYAILRDLSRVGPVLTEQLYGSLSFEKSLLMIKSITRALQSIHFTKEGESFIHGDIKPDNIFLSVLNHLEGQSDNILLIDFGSAHEVLTSGLTAPILRSDMYATPIYLAPEISDFIYSYDKEIQLSLASDIYSVMVIFYVMLFGMPKSHEINHLTQASLRHLRELAENVDLSRAQVMLLNQLFSNGLAEDPRKRIQSAEELMTRLEEISDCFDGIGLTKSGLWHNSLCYVEKRSRHFQTYYQPNPIDQRKASDKIELVIEGRDQFGLLKPIEELINGKENQPIYLNGSGGMGKTTVLAKIIQSKLKDGKQIPLYLDVERYSQEAIDDFQDRGHLLLSQLLYDDYYSVGQGVANYCRLESLFKQANSSQEYMIIVENLHKVTSNSQFVFFELGQALGGFHNVQLVITSRKAMCEIQTSALKKETENSGQKSFVQLTLQKVSSARIINYTQQYFTDSSYVGYVEQRIEELESILSIPFFLTRFIANINLDEAKNQDHRLPVNKGELLSQYFLHLNPLKSNSNEKSSHFFSKLITQVLPRIAYHMEIENKYILNERELELLISETSRGFTRFIEVVLQNEILEYNEESYYFVHDCYLEFFAAYYIESIIYEVIIEKNSDHLEKINHVWPTQISDLFFQILGNQLSEELYLASTSKVSYLDIIYELLESQTTRYRQLMYDIIPYNIYHLSGKSKWLVLLVTLADDSFSQWVIDDLIFYGGRVSSFSEIKKLVNQQKVSIANIKVPSYSILSKDNEIMNLNIQYKVGKAYYFGERIPLDLKESFTWLVKAAESGQVNSQYWLAKMYNKGYGVNKNEKLYRQWLSTAAEKNHCESQKELAYSYLTSSSNDKDKKVGMSWYVKAAKNGQPLMQLNMVLYYINNHNFKQAKKWLTYMKVTDNYYKYEALLLLGWLYESDLRYSRNLLKAVNNYQQAALFGKSEAFVQLMYLYWREGSTEQLLEWSETLAEMNYLLAQAFFSWLLFSGKSSNTNYTEATKWFERACKQQFNFQELGWMKTAETKLENFISEADMYKWLRNNGVNISIYKKKYNELNQELVIKEGKSTLILPHLHVIKNKLKNYKKTE